ncbi:MAG: 3-oxoacyl-ACP reductase FabG [Alphaproteobacteria bacterium]
MFDLNNKVALVTGASGGIGSSIAKTLYACGANVIISGTNEVNLKQLSAELVNRNTILVCNLKDRTQTENLVEEAISVYGKLDILVCNAGITKDNLSIRMKNEDFEEVININLTSSFILNKSAIKHMMKNKWGRIINISSIIGTTGNAGQANYSASKAGLNALTRSLAQEVGSRGITINAVAPGFIETPMTEVLSSDHKDNLLKSIPMGRFGKPEDVASTIAFLASEEASYITGQTIHVNGGMLMT